MGLPKWMSHKALRCIQPVPEKANTQPLKKPPLTVAKHSSPPSYRERLHEPQNLVLFDIALLQHKVGCPEKVCPPNTHPATYLASKPDRASRPSGQRNEPRAVSVTVQWTPFSFSLFLPSAACEALSPPSSPTSLLPPFGTSMTRRAGSVPFPHVHGTAVLLPTSVGSHLPSTPSVNHKPGWAPSAMAASPRGPCWLRTLPLPCQHQVLAHLSLLLPFSQVSSGTSASTSTLTCPHGATNHHFSPLVTVGPQHQAARLHGLQHGCLPVTGVTGVPGAAAGAIKCRTSHPIANQE